MSYCVHFLKPICFPHNVPQSRVAHFNATSKSPKGIVLFFEAELGDEDKVNMHYIVRDILWIIVCLGVTLKCSTSMHIALATETFTLVTVRPANPHPHRRWSGRSA